MTTMDLSTIGVVIAADRSTAQLIVPAPFPRQMLSVDACTSVVREQGVEITDDVLARIEALLESDGGEGTVISGIIARATPPEHGQDGAIHWLVDQKRQDELSDACQESGVDHYARTAFTTVHAGEVVATVDRPTEGTDGRDVTGRVLTARPGRPCRVQFDETLLADATGKVVAQCEGVLHRAKGRATIRQVIEIAENVDFSTGHIDFNGDVLVRRGVRDCFQVRARGDVQVLGLIEAAHIRCGGNLLARGGFAGREQGTVDAGGNIEARYLDAVRGRAGGDLIMQREVINCELEIGGQVRAGHGAIIGGRIAAAGRIDVGTLGSNASVATEVVLGTVPRLEPLAARLTALIERLEAQRAALLSQRRQLQRLSIRGVLGPNERERKMQIDYEMAALERTIQHGRSVLDRLHQRIAQRRTVDLNVARRLYCGSILTVDGSQYRITEVCRGPLRIFLRGRELMCQRGDSPAAPLAQIADVKVR